MPPEFGVGYTTKGSVVILPSFLTSDVGRAKLVERAVYLWLAQQGNHQPFTKPLDGRTITVLRGEWFGSLKTLSEALGVDKKTLMRIIWALTLLGAISVEHIERAQRWKKGTVNGGEMEPFNGGRKGPQRSGNRTDVRCLGTLVKVHGWLDFAVARHNGGNFPPQVSTTKGSTEAVRAPRLTTAQRRENARATALVQDGGI